jgi:hypothetical protein
VSSSRSRWRAVQSPNSVRSAAKRGSRRLSSPISGSYLPTPSSQTIWRGLAGSCETLGRRCA